MQKLDLLRQFDSNGRILLTLLECGINFKLVQGRFVKGLELF